MKLDRHTAFIGSIAVIAAMLLLSAWAWVAVEADEVPVHWGLSGEPDRYGSKFEGLLLLPLVTLAAVALLWVLPLIEPRRENLQRSWAAYVVVWLAIVAFLAVLHVLVVVAATGRSVDMSVAMGIGIGLLFVAIGFMLGRVRSNYMFGLRTPWTLTSERSWERSHALAGRLFLVTGLMSVAAGVLAALGGPSWLPIAVILVGALGSGVVATVYSYLVWREDPERVAR